MYKISMTILTFLLFVYFAHCDEENKPGTTIPTGGPPTEMTTSSPVSPLSKPLDENTNCTSSNDTSCDKLGVIDKFKDYMSDNQGMLMRTFYVLLGVTAIVVVYFVVRTVRLRRFRNKSKRYGIISQNDDNLEMRPLDQEDDEDDMTVFEINHK